MSTPIIKLQINILSKFHKVVVIKFIEFAAERIITAVQPINCNTFKIENRYVPYFPKDIFVEVIAGIFSLVPIIPPRINILVPIKCPNKIIITPFLKPSGAISPPVKISEMDIAAQNHKNKNVQKPNFSLSLFIHYPYFLIQCAK